MPKPRTPSQKKNYAALNKRLATYISLIQDIYNKVAQEASRIALDTGYSSESDVPFSFSDFTETSYSIDTLLRKFASDTHNVIYAGTTNEWAQSNLVQDLLASKALKAYRVTEEGKRRKYFRDNTDALQAFQQRKDKGFNLSQKIWAQSQGLKTELEAAISTAIEKGTSAVTLSKQVSKYLHDYKSLAADYKEKYGKATEARDCEYRSIRLARSEINMAYRTAEQTRWRQMDFILGYEIKLSGSHPQYDICDTLAGKYPKDFVWTGWHPNDICYAVPIVASEEEFWQDNFTPQDCKEYVGDVPEQFKTWCAENAERIYISTKTETLPYFIEDNYNKLSTLISQEPKLKKPTYEDIVSFVNLHKYITEHKENVVNIIHEVALADPSKAQHYFHQINENISHSVFNYARVYKGRSEEIKALLNSIERLEYKDEKLRCELINKLKRLCAEECKRDLESWGHIKGLSFFKFEPNYTISYKQSLEANGIKIEVPLTQCDLLIFRDKYGKKFAYPVGAKQSMFSASNASGIINNYPPYFRKGIKQVTFLHQRNPLDKYWQVKYNNPAHISLASDGGKTTFYLPIDSIEEFNKTMAHEGGHIIDGSTHKISSSKDWREAVVNDDAIYEKVPKLNRVSRYAKTNDIEDFAECYSAYITDHKFFKERFPNRAKFFRKLAQHLSGTNAKKHKSR